MTINPQYALDCSGQTTNDYGKVQFTRLAPPIFDEIMYISGVMGLYIKAHTRRFPPDNCLVFLSHSRDLLKVFRVLREKSRFLEETQFVFQTFLFDKFLHIFHELLS